MKIVPSKIDASAEENEKINEDVKGKRSATTKRRIRFFLRIKFFFRNFNLFFVKFKLDSKNVIPLGPKTFEKTRDTLSTKTNHWKSSKSKIMKISPKKVVVAPH